MFTAQKRKPTVLFREEFEPTVPVCQRPQGHWLGNTTKINLVDLREQMQQSPQDEETNLGRTQS
jgi:hypothetical protein